jgi:hypothetical protein
MPGTWPANILPGRFPRSPRGKRPTLNLNDRRLSIDGDGMVELAGTIIGAGEIRIDGTGTLVISNASTFDSYLSASAGTVWLGASLPNVKVDVSQFGGSLIGTGRVASVLMDCGTNLSFVGISSFTLTM